VSEINLRADSVVRLVPLHIGPAEEDGHEVGDPRTGVFISLPDEGVALVRSLDGTRSLETVIDDFSARYGTPPDLVDFVQALMECGFVAAIDDRPLDAGAAEVEPVRGWSVLANVRSEKVAWLLSRPVLVAGVGTWVACVLFFVLEPQLWPTDPDAIITDQAAVSTLLLAVLGWSLVFFHEIAHLLVVRAMRCDGALTISHRLHFVVAQTDMTSIRTAPRWQRHVAYLAGLTLDTTVLLGCLVLEAAGFSNGLTRAVVFLLVVNLGFEFAFFMRTDLYFVLVNGLRLGNLMQDTRHYLANLAAGLIRRPLRHDLSQVPARELRFVRGYAVLCVLGVGAALGNFALFGIPVIVELARTAGHGLTTDWTTGTFWDGVVFLTLTALNFGLLGYVLLRARLDRRRDAGREETLPTLIPDPALLAPAQP
jgi:putative peptide zinc metalloprotease protein